MKSRRMKERVTGDEYNKVLYMYENRIMKLTKNC
jgi:hypothetical protein